MCAALAPAEAMLRIAVPILIALLTALPAVAQAPPRLSKPYRPVAITPPAASDDASFIAFRAALAAAVKTRIYAGLAPLVVAQGFFWERDFSQAFDPRKPAVDNLAAAVALEQGNGTGWHALAAFAAEATVEPLDSRPGTLCAPARPAYDSVAFSRLLDTTYTTGADWAYPRADETPVYTAPDTDSAKAGALTLHFVRLMGITGAAATPERSRWTRIALPDGELGFVAPGGLTSLTAERLCYAKDPLGVWRIAGYIGRAN
jgi:hypothetical protein